MFAHRADSGEKTGAKSITLLLTVILNEMGKRFLADDVNHFWSW
jgi:hypothetical protein